MAFEGITNHSVENTQAAGLGGKGASTGGEALGSGRHEQTLLGCALGAARDLLPGNHDSAKEAQSDDSIARIVADTAVSLPVFGTAASALIRGAVLINPHGSVSSNLSGFALNAAEGAALNKIGRAGAADSFLCRAVGARLGEGLAAEAATQLTIGFGFGAVRTGFDAQTWQGSDGRFDLLKGAKTTLEAGAIGAPINMVAGMVGVRVARAGTPLISSGVAKAVGQIADRQVAQTAASVAGSAIAMAGSGYASGAVFGGLDAFSAHKNWTEILQAANEGGIIGAITGGALGGTEALRSRSAFTLNPPNEAMVAAPMAEILGSATARPEPAHSVPLAAERYAEGETLAMRRPREMSERTTSGGEQIALYDRFAIKPSPMPGLEELSNRFSRRTIMEETRPVAVTEEKVTGIGVRFRTDESGKRTIESTVKNGPADTAGIRPGAEVTEVNGKSAAGMTVKEGIRLIRDYTGDKFSLTVKDAGGERQVFMQPGQESVFFENFRPEQMRIYGIRGLNTELALPEKFAQSADEVRPLRIMLGSPEAEPFRNLLPATRNRAAELYAQSETDPQAVRDLRALLGAEQLQKLEPYLSAYARLQQHPHGMSILPEELIPLLEEMPERNRFKRITLLPDECYLNPQFDHDFNTTGFKAAATADTRGRSVELWNLQRKPWENSDPMARMRETLYHEDSHFDDPVNKIYAAGADLETFGLSKSPYFSTRHASDNHQEDRATHRAVFLTPDPDDFLNLTERAPIRAALIARDLEAKLNNAPAGGKSPYDSAWRDRIAYVKEEIEPEARQHVYNNLFGGDVAMSANAATVLKSLGIKEDIPYLEEMAVRHARDAAGPAILDTAAELAGKTPQDQFKYLTDLAQRQPSLKDLAIERLQAYGDTNDGAGKVYADILKRFGSLEEAQEGMRKQLSAGPDEQLQAIRALRAIGTASDLNALDSVIKSGAPVENRRAALDTALDLYGEKARQFEYLSRLAQPNSPARQVALDKLASMHDPRAWSYAQLYGAMGDPNKTPDLVYLAVTMPNAEGRRMAFDELLRLTDGNRQSQFSFAKAIMKRAPDLRAHGLDYLASHGFEVGDLVNPSTLETIARHNDLEAVRPLLKAALERPELEPSVRSLLSRYSSNIVKFYGRELERQTPMAQHARLRDLMNNGAPYYSRRNDFRIAASSG